MKFTGWKQAEKIELDIPEVNATHVAHLERGFRHIDIWFADGKFYQQIAVNQISQQIEIKHSDKPETWAVFKAYNNYIFLAAYENEPFFSKPNGGLRGMTVVTSLPRLIDYVNTKSIPDGLDPERNEWALNRYFKFDPLKRVQELEKKDTLTLSGGFLRTFIDSIDQAVYQTLVDQFERDWVTLEEDRIVVFRGREKSITTGDIRQCLENAGYTVQG